MLAALLVGAAAAKVPAVPRRPVWLPLIAVEAGLGIAVAAGVRGAPVAAAALLAAFALWQVREIARGRTGAPCGCFGARSRIGWPGVVRAALPAAGFASIPFLPDTRPSTQAWLAAGLVVALAAVALLAVGMLALARELGELRLSLGPQAALSLADEGPELGSRTALIERFAARRPLSLAVFSSPGCRLCQALEPSLRLLARDPHVELEVFDEEQDAAAWTTLRVPGSPYGVVLDPQGTVLAKGSFNTLPQLEGLLAAAERV